MTTDDNDIEVKLIHLAKRNKKNTYIFRTFVFFCHTSQVRKIHKYTDRISATPYFKRYYYIQNYQKFMTFIQDSLFLIKLCPFFLKMPVTIFSELYYLNFLSNFHKYFSLKIYLE